MNDGTVTDMTWCSFTYSTVRKKKEWMIDPSPPLKVKLLSSPLQQGVSLLPHLYSLPLSSLWNNGDFLFILVYSYTWLNSVKDKEKTFPWASPTISFSPELLLSVRLINLNLFFLYLYCGWREVFQGKTQDSFNSRVSQERSAHEP